MGPTDEEEEEEIRNFHVETAVRQEEESVRQKIG
jgi:hypothetical protein